MTVPLPFDLRVDVGRYFERNVDDWWGRAACAGMAVEVFYPLKGGSTRQAKEICAGCPVLEQCRAWNDRIERTKPLTHLHGVFAGEAPDERIARRAGRDRPYEHEDVASAFRGGGFEAVAERFGITRAAAVKRVLRARLAGALEVADA